MLPPLAEGDRLELKELKPEQKFTQPPPRFSEATLVKALEENGIGRPCTYASIIGVIQARDYVNKIEGRFKPTMLGRMLVDKLLQPGVRRHPRRRVHARAGRGARRDRGGQGRTTSRRSPSFYKKFEKDLKRADKEMLNFKEGVEPDPPVACDKCGKPMVEQGRQVRHVPRLQRLSRVREHARARDARSRAPKARASRRTCENCGKPMVVKRGRFGQFLACTGYPECKTTRKIIATKQGMTAAKPDQILDEKCPKCESNLVIKQGRFGEFTACTNYPECKYVKQKTHRRPLPEGRRRHRRAKSRRGKVFFGCANYPDCDFTLVEQADRRAVPGLRRAVPGREDHQAARPPADLQQRGLRLRQVRGAATLRRQRVDDVIHCVTIVGGGLAGCEAAWQAASAGVPVVLHEMRPVRPTAVHKTDELAELVCSNSFRGDKLDNAVGLLKEEMRRLGSLVMRAADRGARAGRRGAGGRSRAVRRARSPTRSRRIRSSTIVRGEVPRIPDEPTAR